MHPYHYVQQEAFSGKTNQSMGDSGDDSGRISIEMEGRINNENIIHTATSGRASNENKGGG